MVRVQGEPSATQGVESDGAAIGVSGRVDGRLGGENAGGIGPDLKQNNQEWSSEFVQLEADEVAFSVGSWAFVLLEGDEMA